MSNKNKKGWNNRPQQGQPQNNNQPKVEQPKANAPLANVADSAPVIEYATEAELASLITLLDRLDESAQKFGDVAVEAMNSITGQVRGLIVTIGSISAEDQKAIDDLKAEIENIEIKAGARSDISAVADFAIKCLEEGVDEICAKWRENQSLIAEFGGDEVQQMLASDYKNAVETLAFQQVTAFVWATADLEGTPSVFTDIEEDYNAILNDEVEEPQPEEQPQIAAV